VISGAAQMAYGAAADSYARNPAFAIASGIPFGLTARQQSVWLLQGGGNDIFNDVCRPLGICALPLGNTGGQMGGWYRKEIASLADLSGLRLNVGGLAAGIVERLGGAPQALAPDEVHQALECAAIDGAEPVGPYDEAALDLARVARYYYAPAFWSGSRTLHLFIDLAQWDALPKTYRSAIANAAAHANSRLQARTDAATAVMLRTVAARGARLRAFPRDLARAAQTAANQLYTEIASGDPGFKALLSSMTAFRDDELLWLQLAEYSNPGSAKAVL
jgi:TRAP-type mannitol/chloroaromatic compound transport system substrate-binding protein